MFETPLEHRKKVSENMLKAFGRLEVDDDTLQKGAYGSKLDTAHLVLKEVKPGIKRWVDPNKGNKEYAPEGSRVNFVHKGGEIITGTVGKVHPTLGHYEIHGESGKKYEKLPHHITKVHSEEPDKPATTETPKKSEPVKKEPEAAKPAADQPKHSLSNYNTGDRMKRAVQWDKFIKDKGISSYDLNYKPEFAKKKEELEKEFNKVNPPHEKYGGAKNDVTEKIGLKDTIFNLHDFRLSDAEQYVKNSRSWDNLESVDAKVKKAADFLTSHKALQEKLKAIDGWCASNNAKASIDYSDVKVGKEGKIGTVEVHVYEKWDRYKNDQPSVKINLHVSPDSTEILGLEEKLSGMAHVVSTHGDHKDLDNYKFLKSLAKQVEPDVVKDNPKFDEDWIKLKKSYETSTGDIFKQVQKVDANTVHFTVGHVGKKNLVHDTIRSASAQRPPDRIGDYVLQGSGKILGHDGKLTDKDASVKAMLKNDNEYSEYEHNVAFTYLYKKEKK